MSYTNMEPEAMGQIKEEAAKLAHEELMQAEDSATPEEITKELDKGNPWTPITQPVPGSNARITWDRQGNVHYLNNQRAPW